MACSSAGAFRQISASPATLNTCGHAQPTNQPPLSALTASSTRMSSEVRPMASRMPLASDLALLPMLACSPAAGRKSQPATYTGTNHPPDTRAISTNTIRTVVTLKPRHAATPAATPPPSRSAGSRRSGPPYRPGAQPERPAVPRATLPVITVLVVVVPALRMFCVVYSEVVRGGKGWNRPAPSGQHRQASTVRPAPSGQHRQASRRSVAHLVSWCRVESCSLRSTDDTWLSTVLTEMYSSRAISL